MLVNASCCILYATKEDLFCAAGILSNDQIKFQRVLLTILQFSNDLHFLDPP